MSPPEGEVCRERDRIGLYRLADQGLLRRFPGVSRRYDPPASPDLELATQQTPVDVCVERILDLLKRRGVLK